MENIEQQKDEILLLLLSWFSVKIMWSRFIALISSRNVYEWEGKTEPCDHITISRRCTSWLKSRKVVKLQIPAGKANPAPPVGPALGQAGVNIMGFCKEFNARTQEQAGLIIPVEISVYEDRSFTFITKTPPAPVLLKKQLA